MNNSERFLAKQPVDLNKISTTFDNGASEDETKDLLDDLRKELAKLQDTMFAHNRYSMLVCLQGMDTSGKDSLVREVFKDINPRGLIVHSFKAPGASELEHEYLWRHFLALPQKGMIAVFNRTHYENVLVTRVHPEYLRKENIPGIESGDDIPDDFWEMRFEQIKNFEKHLVQNGTILMKFFLHLGKEEQRKRLLRRLDEEEHNWKFSPGDLEEREYWTDYMRYYADAINNTSTKTAPWHIIPADDKHTARALVASILLETLQGFTDIKEPKLDDKVAANIRDFRERLRKEE